MCIWFLINTGIENDEDIQVLNAEITELQKSNLETETEVSKIQAEVCGIEIRLKEQEEETQLLRNQMTSITNYLSSMQNMLTEKLSNIRLPQSTEHLAPENFYVYLEQLLSFLDNVGRENGLYQQISKALADVKL